MDYKIGVLLPRSDTYPSLGMDVMNGLKLAQTNTNFTTTYLVEGIGTATEDSLLKICEKLILQENIDSVISFCGDFLLEKLVKLFNGYKKPLIHLDLGGRILKKEHVSDYVVHHTLNFCNSAYAAGVYAAKNIGKKVAVLSSAYDGGYLINDCFVKGFNVEGGEIVTFHVSPIDYKSLDFSEVINQIEASEADMIFASYSHNEAKKIFKEIATSRLNGTIQIITIPSMTDASIHDENYHVEGVKSVSSYSFADDNENMISFKESYLKEYEDSPTIMALLGYEAGLVFSELLTPEGKVSKNLRNNLLGKTLETPRGTVGFNDYNESQPLIFKVCEFTYTEDSYNNSIAETIENNVSTELNTLYESIPYTGWQNPYICT